VTASWTWVAAVLVSVAALLVSEARGDRVGVWVCKPAASVLFVLAGMSQDPFATPYGRWVAAGLVLGAVGDVLLIPKDPRAFLAGLGSFLLGHVAYAAGFVARGVAWDHAGMALLVMLVPLLLVGRWLLPNVKGGMRVPVLAYMVVITVMVALAYGSTAQLGGWPILVAAVAFFLSDLSVARDRFVAHAFVNKAWGLPLYYGAQVLFALTIHA